LSSSWAAPLRCRRSTREAAVTSPLEAYLRRYPHLRLRDREQLLRELHANSDPGEDFAEFRDRLLRDPVATQRVNWMERVVERNPWLLAMDFESLARELHDMVDPEADFVEFRERLKRDPWIRKRPSSFFHPPPDAARGASKEMVPPSPPELPPLSDPSDPRNIAVAAPSETAATPKPPLPEEMRRRPLPEPPPPPPHPEIDTSLASGVEKAREREAAPLRALDRLLGISDTKRFLDGEMSPDEEKIYLLHMAAGMALDVLSLGAFMRAASRARLDRTPAGIEAEQARDRQRDLLSMYKSLLPDLNWRKKLIDDMVAIKRAAREQIEAYRAEMRQAEEAYDFARAGELAGEIKNLEHYLAGLAGSPVRQHWDAIRQRILPWPERPQSRVISAFGRRYQQFVNQLHPLNAAVQLTSGRWTGSTHLLPEANFYVRARQMAGNVDRFVHFVKYGTFLFDRPEAGILGKSLEQVFRPILHRYDDAVTYAVAKRMLEMERRGFATGADRAAMEAVVNEVEAGARLGDPDFVKFVQFQRDWVQYSRDLLRYLVDAGVIDQGLAGRILAHNLDFVPARLVPPPEGGARGPGSGVYNPVRFLRGSEWEWLDPVESTLRNTYTYIHIAERNAVHYWLTRAAMRAGMPQIAERVAVRVRPIELQDAELAAILRRHGVPEAEHADFAIFRPEFWRPNPHEIVVMVNGKREIWRVDPAIADALALLDRGAVHDVVKLFAIPAMLLRAGATRQPGFALPNFFRDQMSALMNTKYGYTPLNVWDAIGDFVWRGDGARRWGEWVRKNWQHFGRRFEAPEPGPMFKEAMRAGGTHVNVVSIDEIKAQMAALGVKPYSHADVVKYWGTGRPFIQAAQLSSNLTEYMTRLGAYINARNKGASPRAAAYEMREVSVDFAVHGAQMQALRLMSAFANASLQGVDRFGRAIISNPERAAAVAVFGNFLPDLLLWMANRDDPRWRNLPDHERWNNFIFLGVDWRPIPREQWETGWEPVPAHLSEKDRQELRKQYPVREEPDGSLMVNKGALANWHRSYPLRVDPETGEWQANMGQVYKFPKAWEIGVSFGSLPIAALNAYLGEHPEASSGILEALVSAYVPSNFFMPNALVVPIEMWADRSMFTGRRLTPYELQQWEPKYRAQPFTSEVAQRVAEGIDAIIGRSEFWTPIHVDHLVRGWGGAGGAYLVKYLESTLRRAGVFEPSRAPAETWTDVPVVGRFVARYPSYASAPLARFYEELTAIREAQATFRGLQRHGREAEQEGVAQRAVMARMDHYAQALSVLRRAERNLYAIPTRAPGSNAEGMTAEEKRALADELYRQMARIAIDGLYVMEQLRQAPPLDAEQLREALEPQRLSAKQRAARATGDQRLIDFSNLSGPAQIIILRALPESERRRFMPYARDTVTPDLRYAPRGQPAALPPAGIESIPPDRRAPDGGERGLLPEFKPPLPDRERERRFFEQIGR
jgi:hypothetical protein